MQLKKGDHIQVDVETLVFGGQGLGPCSIPEKLVEERPSTVEATGMKTFVSNVIPGDRVQVALTKLKKGYFEGDLVSVDSPSPLRIEPKCQHFSICGGCTWQNLGYDDQLRFKQKIVAESIERIGGWSAEDVAAMIRPILGSDSPWYYRNKMELSFDHPPGGDIQVGLHLPKRRYDVFDMEACFLQSSLVAQLAKTLRQFANAQGLSVFHPHRGKGLLKNVFIREGKNTDQVMVNVVTSMEDFPQIGTLKDELSSGEWADQIDTLIWTRVHQKRGQRTQRDAKVLWGRGVIDETLKLEGDAGELRFEIAPDAFFQPNTKQAERLYAAAIELAELSGDEVVYDLYCGTGTIGLFCAHRAKQIYGIEVVPAAVENARANAERNGITNADFWTGDVASLLDGGKLAAEFKAAPPDVIIVDPPRAGLAGDVPRQIAALSAPRIVYVSCNPTTLARDLKILSESGYALKAIQPVDMFPHTYHIETIALLEKGEGPSGK